MARKRKADALTSQEVTRSERLAVLAEATLVANVPGPGHWLVIAYQPTSLFSLKTSLATSSVGKTLLVPHTLHHQDGLCRCGFPHRVVY